jgi:septum formation protein
MVEGNSVKTIVLASASPRRKEMLEQLGLKFEVEPSNHIEDIQPRLKPHELAKAISQKKALAVASRRRNAIIIAADTIGVLEGKILGKPKTAEEAGKMLAALSGKSHLVITGFTILDTSDNRSASKSVETRVYVKKLSPEEINSYIASGEPLDKAGAYAIQGLGATIIERVEGDYFNVVGLPLSTVVESLKKFGVRVL